MKDATLKRQTCDPKPIAIRDKNATTVSRIEDLHVTQTGAR